MFTMYLEWGCQVGSGCAAAGRVAAARRGRLLPSASPPLTEVASARPWS